jgi:thiol-disulfide isomerase/thioredoxin
LSLVGCSLFGKKAPAKPDAPAAPSASSGWPSTGDGPGTTSSDSALPARVNGVLAGRVIDSYDHRPPPTFIQVVSAQGAKGAPAEVAADSQGYFTIQGLQPGQHYELIARTRDGESKLAGRVWAIPPNPRVLIFMSSDFATPNTPAAPGPPTIPGQKRNPQSAQLAPPTSTDLGNASADAGRDPAKTSSIGPLQRSVDIGAPQRVDESPAPSSDSPQGVDTPRSETPRSDTPRSPQPRLENIVRPEAHVSLPVANVPPQVRSTPPEQSSPYPPNQPAPAVTPPVRKPSTPPRVPSCVLAGRQLDNFTLNDLNAQPWEYRHHVGRLVLLDFWGTWCVPCRQAIPHLNILQSNYGRYGLEVIGIAYEEGSLQDQIRKVQGVRDRLGINYRLLLGGGDSCPVKTQFAVNAFPTLILLDQNQRIIWRQEGLDGYKLQELELLIKQQLAAR